MASSTTSSKGTPLLQVVKDGWFEEIQQLWTGESLPYLHARPNPCVSSLPWEGGWIGPRDPSLVREVLPFLYPNVNLLPA